VALTGGGNYAQDRLIALPSIVNASSIHGAKGIKVDEEQEWCGPRGAGWRYMRREMKTR